MLTNSQNNFMLSDKAYGIAKHLVQIILPAVASLYFGLAAIWGLPRSEEVVGTLAVLATFLGVVLGISGREYYASGAAYDGQMVINKTEDGTKVFGLELDLQPEEFERRDAISFQIINEAPPNDI